MWNWKEFYQMADMVMRYTKVLGGGESMVRLEAESSSGEPFLLHTISGTYDKTDGWISFCGYQASKMTAARLVCLYLTKLQGEEKVLFNAVFLRYGGKNGVRQKRKTHGIRMVYRRMAGEKTMGNLFWNGDFQKMVVIGRKETQMRKVSVEELLRVFAEAADEKGMLMMMEQNVRMVCQGMYGEGVDAQGGSFVC